MTEPQATTVPALLDRHAGMLLDVYGVLFDARGPLPGAGALIAELERRGTPYRIVTNDASRSQTTYSQRFAKYGIRVAPERFVTSGSLLPGFIRERGLVGARTLVLGTADSVAFVREGGAQALTLPPTPPRRPADAPRAASHGRDDTQPLFGITPDDTEPLGRADDTEPLPGELRAPAVPIPVIAPTLFGTSRPPAPIDDARSRAETSGAALFGTARPPAPIDDPFSRADTSDVTEKSIAAIAAAFGDVRMVRETDEIDAIAVCDDDGFDFLRGIELALSLLVRAIEAGRTPTLILPNPDLVYPKGGGDLGFTAGAIALLLEAALARRFPARPLRFTHLGKPEPLLFTTAAKQLGLAPSDLVMIGDQLETDIAGARAAGCKAALLAGVSRWEHARDHSTIRPDYLLETL
ncbi:MAG TPA: HAD hydrolase-like protein [Kofleriaceae bacterium]